MLKHFEIDETRHNKVVDVEFYQMSLIAAVESARKREPELFTDDGIYLPSWTKFSKNPLKAKGFFVHTLEAIFLGKGNADDMNADFQFGAVPKQRVAMMFMSIDNTQLEQVVSIARGVLQGYRVVGVGGVFGVTNATAESHVRNEIDAAVRSGDSVLIISGGMAQRSFSVPEITELYLAYDNGEAGASNQKISRVLTTGEVGKVGRIISLSFDPNRDDKFDQLILPSVMNYRREHDLSTSDAVTAVLATVDIYRCTKDGRIRFEIDTYLSQLLQHGRLSRICGRTADVGALDIATLQALSSGNAGYFRNNRAERAQKGKTTSSPGSTSRSFNRDDVEEKEYKTMLKKAQEVITTIVEHIDVLVYGIGCETIDETLKLIDDDVGYQREVERKFGVDYSVIRFLFEHNIIKRELVELYWSAA